MFTLENSTIVVYFTVIIVIKTHRRYNNEDIDNDLYNIVLYIERSAVSESK